MSDLWEDIYEPKTLDDVVGQKELVKMFKDYAKIKYIPSLTLAGSQGIGKTLLAKLFAVELGFIKYENDKQIDLIPGQFYLMNASASRGIDFVRTTIKRLSEKPTIDNTPRLIVLDEFDFTSDAQNAMRSLMQECSSNVRFILITNYPDDIIPPILSRCPMKIVQPLTFEDIKVVVERIRKEKQFNITPEAIEELYKQTQGDTRKLIKILQDVCLVSNYNIQINHINSTDVDIQVAKSILESAMISYDQSREILITIYSKTKNAKDLLEKLYEATYITRFSEDMEKNKIISARLRERIAETDYRLSQGTNQLLQLDSLLNYIKLIKFIPLQCPHAK